MHFSELLVVLVVVLLVFPPKKLPELAQTLARAIRYAQAIKNQIFTELQPIKNQLKLEGNMERAEETEENQAKTSDN